MTIRRRAMRLRADHEKKRDGVRVHHEREEQWGES